MFPPLPWGYQGIRVSLRVPLDPHSFALSLTPVNQCRGAPEGGRALHVLHDIRLTLPQVLDRGVLTLPVVPRTLQASSVEPAVVVPWWGNCCCRRRCEACATVVAGV